MALLELDQVSFTYHGPSGTVPAVKEATGSFTPGKVYALVGRSGSGKSTLLTLLAGLDTATSGEVRFDGTSLARINRDAYRRHKVGVVFQAFHLLPQLTAIENVVLALEICGWPLRDRVARAARLLEQVGIDELTARRPALRLSGGEQQRVAIARALGPDPGVIIADEPTGNLDSENGDAIMDLLCGIAHNEDRCVIVATHAREVAQRADEIWLMRNGKLERVMGKTAMPEDAAASASDAE